VVKESVCDSRTVAPKHDPRKEARRRARLFTRRQGERIGETRADSAELLHVLMRGITSRSPFVRGVASVTNDIHSSYRSPSAATNPLKSHHRRRGWQRRTLREELAAIPFLTGDVGVTGSPFRHLARAVRLDLSVPSGLRSGNSRGSTPPVWHNDPNEGKSTWTFELKRRRSLNRPIGVLRATWESVARREGTR
jgi:hypothetical protein